MKASHRRHELPNQADRRVDVQIEAACCGAREEIREPDAVGPIREKAKGGVRSVQPLHALDLSVVGVTEGGQPAHALAQRELECRYGREFAADGEQLLSGLPVCVDHRPPLANAVTKRHAMVRVSGSRSSIHEKSSGIEPG
jgi:hypothetical protein